MKEVFLIFIIILFFGLCPISAQNTIQSTCSIDSLSWQTGIQEFSYEIALKEMKSSSHYLHDSILAPQFFVDSIKSLLVPYHNAIGLSDSIVDYRNFEEERQEIGSIIITFDTPDKYFIQNDSLIILNDTLSNCVDSLKMQPLFVNDNQIVLLDTNKRVNIYGNFNFLYNISGITKIELNLIVADLGPCYKLRTGNFTGDSLHLSFSDYNFCDDNSYSNIWKYVISDNCLINIQSIVINSVQLTKDESLKVYPNPFGNQLFFKTQEKIKSIVLIGEDGKIERQITDNSQTIINTKSLQPGLYMLHINYKSGNTEVRKLIKN